MKRFLILFLLLATPLQAQTTTAVYGTVVTSLTTTSVTTATGTTFAVPGNYAAMITWQTTAVGSSAVNIVLQGSLDNSTWVVLDTSTVIGGEIRNFGFTAVKFIRINLVSRTGAGTTTGTVVTSRGFITGAAAGNLQQLSVTGQILGGDGTQSLPTYSFAADPDTGWYRSSNNGIAAATAGTARALLDATSFRVVSTTGLGFSPAGNPNTNADVRLARGAAGKLILDDGAAGATSFLAYGCLTSSCPAIKRTTTRLDVRLADDSGGASWGALSYNLNNNLAISAAQPSLSSGFGTSPSLVSGRLFAFRWNVGTGGVATTGVITVGDTATTGWNCDVSDLLNTATHATVQTASTTTTASFAAYSKTTGVAAAWVSGAVIAISCIGF